MKNHLWYRRIRNGLKLDGGSWPDNFRRFGTVVFNFCMAKAQWLAFYLLILEIILAKCCISCHFDEFTLVKSSLVTERRLCKQKHGFKRNHLFIRNETYYFIDLQAQQNGNNISDI